jgi:hypothetical protein
MLAPTDTAAAQIQAEAAAHLPTTNALLYLDGVNVAFDGFRAINNLSLFIKPGDDGHHHRQNPARQRRCAVRRRPH